MEGVLRIPDPLIHRVALDERVARLPLVREEAAELEQRVGPLPPGRRLLKPKDGAVVERHRPGGRVGIQLVVGDTLDRKSTRLNSSHLVISYAVFCLKKKNNS